MTDGKATKVSVLCHELLSYMADMLCCQTTFAIICLRCVTQVTFIFVGPRSNNRTDGFTFQLMLPSLLFIR